MIGNAHQDAFISRSVAGIVTTLRDDGSPASSMVGFARRGDSLYFSTTTDRLKGRTLARDARACLTVLHAREPWSFVSIEGLVTIHTDNPQELRDLLLDYSGKHPDYAWERSEIAVMIAAPGRAIFQLEPTRVSGVVLPPKP